MIPSAYWSAGIVAAAKNNNILASDIQYALISKYHPSFSFPAVTTRAYGADRVYLWSKYWNIKETPYNKSIFPISNYFKEKIKNLNLSNSSKNKYSTIFISQSRVGRKIFNFAIEFAKQNPKISVAFAPHPDESIDLYPRFNEIFKYKNMTLVSDKETIEVINESVNVVGSYSTSLIEALALGKRVYSLTIGGHEILEREVEKGYIKYISSIKELSDLVSQNKIGNENLVSTLSEVFYNN